ncbi:MAG: hypothetical protein KC619_30715, partial [Myxococcales bacterium]|nr:hypothetical protein [Myxococcales bacterium]
MRAALALSLLIAACDAPVGPSDGSASDDAGMLDAGVLPDAGDAGALIDAGDAGPSDAGGLDAGPPFEPPLSMFFVGNSFTFGGPVPTLVEDLASYAGWPEPNVEYRAVGGQSLGFHRADTTDPAGAPQRVAEGWDVVVL